MCISGGCFGGHSSSSFLFCVIIFSDVPHSFVQAFAVEDHLMVLSFGQSAVWLSFLACAVPTVSWTPDSCHLAGMIDTIACGLSSSSCPSTLWVDRHSVPWACLPHPWVDMVCLDGSLRRMGCPTTAAQDH